MSHGSIAQIAARGPASVGPAVAEDERDVEHQRHEDCQRESRSWRMRRQNRGRSVKQRASKAPDQGR